MRKLDLTGQRFGRLVVIKEAGRSSDGRVRWLCKCDCGNYTSTPSTKTLRNGTCRSCGCIERERPNKQTHGKSNTKLFAVWNAMKQRCYNPNNRSYKNYGGRGITVCQEWKEDFQTFYDWAIANGYKKGLEIDRIDVNGNYEPDNCRWTNSKKNNNNRRNNVKIKIGREEHTVAEWSEITGIPRSTILERFRSGKPLEEILKT